MQPSSIFQVNPSSGTPVFRQLVDQIQRLIACRQLQEGDLLPSTREVARHLVINPMTVSKAYSQLELEGYLLRKKGIGMMVRPSSDSDRPDKVTLLQPALDELVAQAAQLEMSLEEIRELLGKSWRKADG